MEEHRAERKQLKNSQNQQKTRAVLLGTLYTQQSTQLGSAVSIGISFQQAAFNLLSSSADPNVAATCTSVKSDKNKQTKKTDKFFTI